jgi:hypothetical protein
LRWRAQEAHPAKQAVEGVQCALVVSIKLLLQLKLLLGVAGAGRIAGWLLV